ncbi:MAG: tRNA uridine-5-carboxymethylaminomethyl(34) synthesis GTPase MnmE [Spirochaetes bacterium]|nr:tRNA uridine-5-carboxymethylaminomethyl(34) synthesis GTPase MnmE [Spirochaetota bacterium]
MNNKSYYEDIICARATPSGNSAIAVIRISGKGSWEILKKIFLPYKKLTNYESHHIYYGKIIENKKSIDNVVILTYSNGNSFTGEESFEINCHGSEVIITLILKILLSNGIKIAEPGEFSKRAFLNGKIDLAEAEAIMDIVHSSTKKSALIAVRQLSGRLSSEINKIKEDIANLLAEIEVDIDYPEEDITNDTNNWLKKINTINKMFETLIKGFKRGRYYREAIQAVILGKTNSGKSTFFNFLLNEDKAIVSDIHGTTRDFLDGVINVKGFGVRIYDTAGLRKSNDPIEKEGTKRAIELSSNANIIIYIITASEGFTEEDKNNILSIDNDKKILIIINKIDLIKNDHNYLLNNIKKSLYKINNRLDIVKMSALKKEGLNEFNDSLVQLLTEEKTSDAEDPLITNIRHATLLDEANQKLINSIDKIKQGLLDLAAFELREALDNLGEITGEITPKNIIERIFSTFCVGK